MGGQSPFIRGQQSELDYVLYGAVALGAGTIVTAGNGLDLMGVSQATGGLQRTNLPQPNTIPQEWDYFEVQAISLKFCSMQDMTTIFTAINDAFYSIRVAGFAYKEGHIQELVNPSSLYLNNAATSNYQTDQRGGAWIGINPTFTIPSITQVNFYVTFITDLAGLHSTLLMGAFKGKLYKKIVG